MIKPRWKPEDDARLRGHIEHTHLRRQCDWYAYVATDMGRTAGAIQQRCHVLGIHPRKLAVCPKCKRPL